jgi:hypothetical protein
MTQPVKLSQVAAYAQLGFFCATIACNGGSKWVLNCWSGHAIEI